MARFGVPRPAACCGLLLLAACGEEPPAARHETQLQALGVCVTDEECGNPPPCRTAKCVGGECRFLLSEPGCCTTDEDCEPYNICLVGLCIIAPDAAEGQCVKVEDKDKAGCCNYPSDCPPPPAGYVSACEMEPEFGYSVCQYKVDPEICAPPALGIVVNEFMANPAAADDATGEWIELFNPSLEAVDINGWKLMDDGADSFTLASASPIFVPPAGYFLLGRSNNPNNNGNIFPDFVYYNFTLSNGSDEIILLDAAGTEVDKLTYGPGKLTVVEGASMELVSPYMDNADPSSWKPAQRVSPPALDKGTPGEPNTDAFFFYFTPLICNDNNSCTLDTCGKNGEALCRHEPITDCCLYATQCNDGDLCTTDTCQPATLTCVHTQVATCCNTAAACSDGNDCTLDSCVNHLCRHVIDPLQPECCIADAACVDINPCTVDYCAQDPGTPYKTCHHKSPGGVKCCMADYECSDAMPETLDKCAAHKCEHTPNPEFCAGPPPDYCDDGNPCTKDACDLPAKLCQHTPVPGCCAADIDCNDGDSCTQDLCLTAVHTCSSEWIPWCCHDPADCEQFMTDKDLCKTPLCIASACRLAHIPDETCCLTTADCNDKDACTTDACNPGNNTCSHAPVGKQCCNSTADCLEDDDPCTTVSCLANECTFFFIEGCCKGDWECDDDNPCTTDVCKDYRCRFVNLPGQSCCTASSQCPAPATACLESVCSADHQCVQAPLADCQVTTPYIETFSGAKTLAACGWNVAGDQVWFGLVAGGEFPGPDRHVEATADATLAGMSGCLESPFIVLPDPALPATLTFEQTMLADDSATVGIVRVKVSGMAAGSSLEVPLAAIDGPVLSTDGPYAIGLPYQLRVSPFRLRFCLEVPQAALLARWTLDTVQVGSGQPPRFVGLKDDIWLTPGSSLPLSFVVEDEDGPLTGFYVSGPVHLHSKTPKKLDATHTSLVINVEPDGPEDVGEYHVSVEATDGFFLDRRSFLETVYIAKCATDADCDDLNNCSDDWCNPITGCHHDFAPDCCNEMTPCDDGSFCTEDQCVEGTCLWLPVNCDDGNLCTSDLCDPDVGCQHPFVQQMCNDGDVCTWHDTCAAGKCVGLPLDCSDGLECTMDSCLPGKGCENKSLCSDAILCTTDVCTQDGCRSGKAPVGTPWVDGALAGEWPDSSVAAGGAGEIATARMMVDELNLYVALSGQPAPLSGWVVLVDTDFPVGKGMADPGQLTSNSELQPYLASLLAVDFPGWGIDFALVVRFGADVTFGPDLSACFSIDALGTATEMPCWVAAGADGTLEALLPWTMLFGDVPLDDKVCAAVIAAIGPDGKPAAALPNLAAGTVDDVIVFGIPDPMCLTAFCGDGVLDSTEQCDDGLLNSDTKPDACRTNCVLAHCGDGVIDSNEQCDMGPDNSSWLPDACRPDCTPAHCGDGVVDSNEQCDDAEANSDTLPDACRTNCLGAHCGDGVIDSNELCDDGPNNSDLLGDHCRTTCVPPSCGDKVVDPGLGEQCDMGPENANEPDKCKTDCVAPYCGDSLLDVSLGEQCDWGQLNSDDTPDTCRTTCKNPKCGDGTVDTGEECDDGNQINSDGCTAACLTEIFIPDPGDVIFTEIMQNPAKVYDTMGEYLELYNTRDFVIDLSGWVLSDSASDLHTINAGKPLLIQPKSFLVLGVEANSAFNGGITVDYQYENTLLQNGSDDVILTAEGVVVDQVAYDGGQTFPDPKGASMNLDPDHFNHKDNDVGPNWCLSKTPLPDGDFGTPGQPNDQCD